MKIMKILLTVNELSIQKEIGEDNIQLLKQHILFFQQNFINMEQELKGIN